MNTEMNSSTDIRMTDVSVFGRSYEQVHGLGSRPAAERVFGSPGAESAAVPDKKVVKSRASGRKSSRSHTKTDLDGEQKFYLCKKCGNLAGMLNDSGAEIKCCDSSMDRLTAVSMGQVSVRADGDKIYVDFSKVPHTVGHDHHIGWVYIKTARGGQRQILYPYMFPEAVFTINDGDEFRNAFVFCSHHGLWSCSEFDRLN